MTQQQQHVQRLATFCSAVAHALFRGGVAVEQIGTIFRLGLSAECVQCGIRISGEELFVLAQPAFDAAEHPKIRRLRLGDCARHGCDSCYYRVRFWPVGSLDWSALLSEVEAHRDEPVVEIPTRLSILASRFLSFAPSAKACVALGLLVLVFTARQWYLGGRIPFLREPEHFRVDIVPQSLGEQGESHEGFIVDIDPQNEQSPQGQ